ncbi:MAG TPA: HPr-rel-A system PqqD family peptide chaperone [Gemmatimonadales bacterium]|nr:HPr-rel-A system PqqD family peptide chaperone [Gemmatimonadales bacterium]
MDLITAQGRLFFEPLDDDWAVYQLGTRETHVVDALGGVLLRRIAEDACPSEDLAEMVLHERSGVSRDEARRYVDSMVGQWRDAGLVT